MKALLLIDIQNDFLPGDVVQALRTMQAASALII